MSDNPYSVGNELSNGQAQAPQASVRAMQRVAFGLIMGLVVYGVIVLVMTGGRIDGKPEVLGWIAAGFAGLMIAYSLTVPRREAVSKWNAQIAEGIRQKSEQEQMQAAMGVCQIQMIMEWAPLDVAAFFNLNAVSSSRSMINLGIAIALLVLMLIKFPTTTKVTWWIQDWLRDR